MNAFDLPWLPEVAATFRPELKALRSEGGWSEAAVRRLATQRLDFTQLQALARAMQARPVLRASKPLAITVLSNANFDLTAAALVATGPRFDVWLDVHLPPFGTFNQECLDPSSSTNMRGDDFVLLAVDHRGHALRQCTDDPAVAEQMVEQALGHLERLVASLQSHSRAAVIVQTLPMPSEALFGHLDLRVPGTLRWSIDRFNTALLAGRCGSALVMDARALAERVGLGAWHDPTQWNVGKFPFALQAIPLYADAVCRLLAAAQGKSKKCLVLDLDNTLWGGVIGDDGMAGIVLAQGDPVGEAYLSVQATALALRARGIVLAVSSKNDEAVARRVFREHPDMLLREEHIAVFQANWQDKASNLRAIAATLNIGIDALVLLDDNPAERAQVRKELPMVGVPELPEAPESFASTLLAAGYFETVQFTDDDRQRAAQYQGNAARAAVLGSSSDMRDFLDTLAMEAYFAPFDALGRPRISQLINKTNQFNLCTRRYTEAEVAAFEADPSALTLQVRLVDSFGDNGMISVVICVARDGYWVIDTWLMSCRVLNRRLEQAVLNVIVAQAAERDIRRLVGVYRPTEKNGMVADHYGKLGFVPDVDAPDVKTFVLDVATYAPAVVPIRLHLQHLVERAVSLVD